MPAPAPRPLLVVEHETDAGLDLMDAPLRAAVEVRVVRPYLGEPLPGPDDLAGFAGLVVLGGEMAAWEDGVAPWLPATRALLAAAVRIELPTLGVCLGAQLLAHSTGGLAARGTSGLELGLVDVVPLPAAEPLAPGLSRAFNSLSYHGDAVTELPEDAELLATGELYPVQMFRVGACAWGVQYHPEVSAAAFEGWVSGNRALPDGERERLLATARAAASSQQALATAHAEGLLAAAGLGLRA